MRKIIAGLQASLDGIIEGVDDPFDWVDSWEDRYDLTPQIDTCVLGRGMYPDYEQYWSAIQANPNGVSPVSRRVPTKGEIEWARFAAKTPHVVVSKTASQAEWKNTRFVRGLDEIRRMKQQPGKDIYAVGGATLISSLMNDGLIDEIRLVVSPIVLGAGKAMFKDVKERHSLKFVRAEPQRSGTVRLTYTT